MVNYINTDLLPLEINSPWLFENNNEDVKRVDSGKWMLFYDKSFMNEAWNIAKKLYRENKLDGVKSMKCSTAHESPRASTLDEGIIVLYCNNSSNEETIMNIGKNIIEMFDYKKKKIIYYKTDLQTHEGTFATGSEKNYTYKLFNNLYKRKFLINLKSFNQTLPVEETQKIERQYPTKKREKTYPERYDLSVFEKLNKMNGDTELQNDYKKWKDGINYKTNRKIKIDGKIHRELKQKFMIHYTILFEDLTSINSHEYLKETKKIINEIDDENAIIKNYNKLVDSIIEKIQKLKGWNEFIEFEGKYYGITNKVLNNIHRENDCFGEMVFMMKKEKECKGCRDGMAFNGSYSCSCYSYDINKCKNCGFIEEIKY